MLQPLTAERSLRRAELNAAGVPRSGLRALAPAVSASCLEACAPGRADACHAQCGGDLSCWAQCSGSQGVASCVAPCYQSAS